MKTTHLTSDDITWIDDAVSYGNVSTIGAAYNRLIGFRDVIIAGGIVTSDCSPRNRFDTLSSFDDWVRDRYPVFTDDILHPIFMQKN